MYQIFGYYICEQMKAPDYLGLDKAAMLSVSSCFGGVHPDLTNCYFLNDVSTESKDAYRKKWNLADDKSLLLQRDIEKILERSLAIDGRFLNLSDAAYFCKTYFDNASCRVVSVSTTEKYYDMLTKDLAGCSSFKNDFFSNEADEHELLGYDILGWDISRFHTFLCNNLQHTLRYARFNNFCLLENAFEEVETFARMIRDKGEPVEWIPCRIAGRRYHDD